MAHKSNDSYQEPDVEGKQTVTRSSSTHPYLNRSTVLHLGPGEYRKKRMNGSFDDPANH